jgi:uncharacterized membrane protein
MSKDGVTRMAYTANGVQGMVYRVLILQLCVLLSCSWTLSLGEWIIKRLPLVKHIYSASKQVSPQAGCPGSCCCDAC